MGIFKRIDFMFKAKRDIRSSVILSAVMVGVLAMAAPVGQSFAASDAELKQAKKEMRESRKEIRKVMKAARAKVKQAVRGGLVYKTYCVLCHGEKGDGDARMSAVHNNLPLNITKQTSEFYEKIILGGGPAVGRSMFMPTWEDELTAEQTQDLVMYLAMVTDPQKRGEVVFKTNCILCHGVNGDGMGRASVLFDPPPANLTLSDKNDIYKKMIITLGGEAMGRSSVMPIWGMELSEAEIDDVVAYLRTILVVPYPE